MDHRILIVVLVVAGVLLALALPRPEGGAGVAMAGPPSPDDEAQPRAVIGPDSPPRPAPGIHALEGPLRRHSSNPRYFTDESGRAIYLTGSHTWTSLQDRGPIDPPPSFDYDDYLDFMQDYGHNFIRMWMWEQARWSPHSAGDYYYTPSPYLRTGPGHAADGKPRYDLTRFNQAFFDRLRARVAAAERRGIYVSVMMFQGWSVGMLGSFPGNPWPGHPYHRANNINGVDGDRNGDGQGWEIHALGDPAITDLQKALVRKVVDTVNDLDNVLYEIGNELDNSSVAWQHHFVEYIQQYEAGKPKQHPVGMTSTWQHGPHRDLTASSADWISPGGGQGGDWRNDPPVADGKQVIITDTDHLWGVGGDGAWVWKSFLRGLNPIYMDAWGRPDLEPASEDARRSMGYTRAYSERMNLASMMPSRTIASTGYCLAGGGEYLVYLPAGGGVTVDLSATAGEVLVEWFRPANGRVIDGGTESGGARRAFSAPFSGPAVLYLHARSGGDYSPPTGGITHPIDGSVLDSCPVLVEAEASDDLSGVAWVRFYYHDYGTSQWYEIRTDTDGSDGWNAVWDCSEVDQPTAILTTWIEDAAGNQAVDPGGYVHVTLPGNPRTVISHVTSTLPSRPQLDGDLSEWSPLAATILNASSADFVHWREIPAPSDVTAELRSGWDEGNLYFAVRVVDDALVAGSGGQIWRDDSIEIGIDGLNDQVGWGLDDRQFTICLDGRVADRGNPTTAIRAATAPVEGGWALEAAVSASELGLERFDAATVVGFTFGVHDDDDGDDWDSYLIWEGQSTGDNPAEFGRLELEGVFPTPTPTASPTAMPTATPTPAPTATPVLPPQSRSLVSYSVAVGAGEVRLDGFLDEWVQAPSVRLDRHTADYVHPRGLPEPEDASMVLQSGWDPDFLYIAVQVLDERLIADSDQIWRDDGVEIGIDGLHDHVGWQGDDHQITASVDGRVAERGWPSDAVEAAVRPFQGGWALELAVGVEALGAGVLQEGKEIGLTFALHDDDDGGDWDNYMIWAGESTHDSSDRYGHMLLSLAPVSLEGVVWNDADADGIRDTAEPGIAGAVVSVQSLAFGSLRSETTDELGIFGFTDLPSGSYLVKAGELPGYRHTTLASLQRQLAPGGEQLDVAFGFLPTTAVQLLSLEALAENGAITVVWSTMRDWGVSGFEVQRRPEASGSWSRLIEQPVAAGGTVGSVSTYRAVDDAVTPGRGYCYRLIVLPGEQTFGPACAVATRSSTTDAETR